MYADYGFYKDSYNGRLTETEYGRLVLRASAEIDRLTSQRAKTATGEILERVKYAECAVVDELSFQSLGGSGDVTSESNDGVSRSYASAVTKSSRQRIDAAAFTWLSGTNLLFCGI